MFDNVFDDKQWKTARDLTGLKGGLTEKVSMGDEFKRFHQNKSIAAARILREKIALYEKQLKDKHSKDKYYAKLLKVVQDQKAAIDAGIQEAEKPVEPPKIDEDMDKFLDEVVEKQKEENKKFFENTNNDPKVPQMGQQRMVYLKLTKDFPTVEGAIKSEHTSITELLGKCKALQTNPNLHTKPEAAIGVAEKILETLNKIFTKSGDFSMDFTNEARIVRQKEGRETPATMELDRLGKILEAEVQKIHETDHACRLVLKATLQSLGNNPKAQEMLRLLHV